MVKVPTRLNPDAILDPIITTLSKYYQEPVTKPPLDNDFDKKGKPADHLIVVSIPITNQFHMIPRKYNIITHRPLPQSGILSFGSWITSQSWTEIYLENCPHKYLNI